MIVDTNVLIDYLREDSACRDWLASVAYERRATSVATHMELLEGCRDARECREVRQLLTQQFRKIYPLSERISETALHLMERFRPAYSLEMSDALIAATCLVNAEPLATWNRKHFSFVQGLSLITPGYRV